MEGWIPGLTELERRLGVPEGTVKTRVRRGLLHLQRMLRKDVAVPA